VDGAFDRTYSDASEEVQAEHHVMTTWHQNDSVHDVAFFFVWNTNVAEYEFDDFLLLHVDGSPNERHAVEEAVSREAIGEAAV